MCFYFQFAKNYFEIPFIAVEKIACFKSFLLFFIFCFYLLYLQDWHCNERVLHTQAMRRKQLSQQGKTSIAPPQTPPPHPGYAPDAALLAIRRHALQYINPKELSVSFQILKTL